MDFVGSLASSLGKNFTLVNLPAGSEWRFEVDFTQEVTIKVVSGVVEINGTELPNNIDFKFKGVKSCIFSYQDAVIQYHGQLSSEYVSDESIINQYIALHFALQNCRNVAQKNKSVKAPRVLVVGPKDSGKTTLIKILSSYAVKMDSLPLLVNLNPAEGVYTVPGALSATVVNDIFDVEQGWGHSNISGASVFHPTQPAVSFYGYENINSNPSYYRECVSTLANVAESRLQNDEHVNQTGILVDTPALTNKDTLIIDDYVALFGINVVIVLGNERLYIDLKKRYSDKINEKFPTAALDKPFFNVLKFSKSGGCVEKDEAFLRAQQQQQIKQYFYGERKSVLSPYTITSVDYEKLNVYRIVATNKPTVTAGPVAGNVDVSSVLPIGEGMDEEEQAMLAELNQSVETQNTLPTSVNTSSEDEKKLPEEEKEQIDQNQASKELGIDEEQNNDDNTVKTKENANKLIEKIEPQSSYLQNAIIAFTHAAREESAGKIVSSGVLCFGYISGANDQKKKLSVLLPVQGALPNQAVLLGEFRFVD